MVRLCLALFLVAALSQTGCIITVSDSFSGVEGSGEMKQETRAVSDFDSIRLVGSGDVTIQVGSPTECLLTVDDNLLELVETSVEDGQLIIRPTESFRSRKGLQLEISTPQLAAVEVEGSAKITIDDATGDSLDIDISGAASVKAKGQVTSVTVDVSGAGSVDLEKLVASRAEVTISGAGSGSVHATESVQAEINGAGSLAIHGNPPEVKREVNGIGSIRVVD